MNGTGIKTVEFDEINFGIEDYWRVRFTPEAFDKCLKMNIKNNRDLKRKKETFERDMRNGRWVIGTGETIKFNEDKCMCDGQNRVYAGRASGSTVILDVKTMVPNEAFKVLDSGTSREDGDALKIIGIPNPLNVAAISRVTQVLKNGSYNVGSHVGVNIAPSRQEIVDFAILNGASPKEKDHMLYDLTKRFTGIRKRLDDVKRIGASGWFVCWWLTYCKDEERAEEFLGRVLNQEGEARVFLAQVMELNPDGKPKDRDWMIYKYIDTFNASMLGGDYILGSDCEGTIKGYKKLFAEYVDNMRVSDRLFKWGE